MEQSQPCGGLLPVGENEACTDSHVKLTVDVEGYRGIKDDAENKNYDKGYCLTDRIAVDKVYRCQFLKEGSMENYLSITKIPQDCSFLALLRIRVYCGTPDDEHSSRNSFSYEESGWWSFRAPCAACRQETACIGFGAYRCRVKRKSDINLDLQVERSSLLNLETALTYGGLTRLITVVFLEESSQAFRGKMSRTGRTA